MADEHREDAFKRVENEFFTLKYASEINDNAEGYRTVSKKQNINSYVAIKTMHGSEGRLHSRH